MPIPGHPTAALAGQQAQQQLFSLPDHEFWDKHKRQSSQLKQSNSSFPSSLIQEQPPALPPKPPSRQSSIATFRDRSASIQSQSRRLSRKLPPALTESLENLAFTDRTLIKESPLTRIASISEIPIANNTMQPQLPTADSTGRITPTETGDPSLDMPSKQFILHADPPMHDDSDIRQYLSELTITKSNVSTKKGKPASPLQALPMTSLPSRDSSLSVHSKKSLPSLRRRSISSSSLNGALPLTPTLSRQASAKSEFLAPHAQRVQQVNAIMNGTTNVQTVPSPVRTSSSSDSMTPPTLCSGSSATGSFNSACGISWEVLDDIETAERAARMHRPKESRQQRKLRKRAEAEAFNPDQHPSMQQLFEASELEVTDEAGVKVKFGDLVRDRKTVVIFIRHWYCSLCAQYIKSIMAEVTPDALKEADVEMIIIGNGSSKMIDGYKNKHFHLPFKMYTDPKLRLYRALGLTRQTGDAGADEDKGDYLVQSGMEQTVETIKRATKMPLRAPGHFLQLGGEFVFDGPLNVTYTNRMTTTRNHAPIRDVVAAAGVRLEYIHYEPGPAPPPVHREFESPLVGFGEQGGEQDLDEWEAERQAQLERIQELKAMRRKGTGPAAPNSFKRSNSVRIAKVQIVQPAEAVEAEVSVELA